VGEVFENIYETAMLQNQDLAGVPAEAFLLYLGSVDTDPFHELLQEPDLQLLSLAQPCLDELYVEGGPVRGALPLARLHVVAGYDVHDDPIYACLRVGMLCVFLPAWVPFRGLETDLQPHLFEARLFDLGRKLHEDVDVRLPRKPGPLRKGPTEDHIPSLREACGGELRLRRDSLYSLGESSCLLDGRRTEFSRPLWNRVRRSRHLNG